MYLKYKFVNETVEIEVSEKWARVVKKLDKEEYNSNQRERRRCKNFLDTCYRNYDKHYLSQPVFASVERRELYANLGRAISLLLPEQQKLVAQRYFWGIPATEIARRDGVSKSAISHRVGRALDQLKKILTA